MLRKEGVIWIKKGLDLEGGYRAKFVLLGMIYGGKIVETGRLDLKMTQKCKFGLF